MKSRSHESDAFFARCFVVCVVLFLLALVDQRSTVLTLSIPHRISTTNRESSLLATSSANLKDGTEHFVTSNRTCWSGVKDDNFAHRKRKYPVGSVVGRLKQAAMQAAAAKATEQLQESIQMKNTFFSNRSALSAKLETMNNQQSKVGTLRELTCEIDLQLHRARALPWGQYQTHMLYQNSQLPRFQKQPHHVSVLPRDSMAAIITHNNQNEVTTKGQFYASTITHQPNINMTTTTSQLVTPAILTTTFRHVAIILTKRSILREGKRMLTLECAGRIQRLVYAMTCNNYKPSVIVILGDQNTSIQNTTNRGDFIEDLPSSDADLGYAYFIRLLTLSNLQSPKADLSNVKFHLQRSSLSPQAFESISSIIQQEFVPNAPFGISSMTLETSD